MSKCTANFNGQQLNWSLPYNSYSIPYQRSHTYIGSTTLLQRQQYRDSGNVSQRSSVYAYAIEGDEEIVSIPCLQQNSDENLSHDICSCACSTERSSKSAMKKSNKDFAFEKWLAAKTAQKSKELAAKRRADAEKLKEIEERKRLSREKVTKWFKEKQKSFQDLEILKRKSNDADKSKFPKEIMEARIAEWKLRKSMTELRKRETAQEEQQRLLQLKQQRREMAEKAYQKWIREIQHKPKPVPLNKGIISLRGTMSNMFVNPNEWQSILPERANSEE